MLDTKTIEVTEFMFRTEGLPAWFMVGKEIMPNAKGHIVPVFDKSVCPQISANNSDLRTTKTFDCDSLREFHNETVSNAQLFPRFKNSGDFTTARPIGHQRCILVCGAFPT